jgi:7-cyano-7-deazaguanine synthase
MKSAIVLLSGGMDSTTLAYLVKEQFHPDEMLCLSVFYGQKHQVELTFARETADRLGAQWSLLHLASVGAMLKSSLTQPDIAVPHGHYADDNMKITVVPNRNAIMLAAAFGLAFSHEAEIVGLAAHAGDHTIYPDCRPAFVDAFNEMERHSNGGQFPEAVVFAPFLNMTKADIVETGEKLGVPWAQTWSCYEGGDQHCGKCGTCVERREAFELAGVTDPTHYRS